jgi:hypothetical protein
MNITDGGFAAYYRDNGDGTVESAAIDVIFAHTLPQDVNATYLILALAAEAGDEARTNTLSVRLVAPDGASVFPDEPSFPYENFQGTSSTILKIPFFAVHAYGTYAFECSVNGQPAKRVTFQVKPNAG